MHCSLDLDGFPPGVKKKNKPQKIDCLLSVSLVSHGILEKIPSPEVFKQNTEEDSNNHWPSTLIARSMWYVWMVSRPCNAKS